MVEHDNSSSPLWRALSEVQDPEIRRPITELGMVQHAQVEQGIATIKILLTIVGCPAATQIEQAVHAAASSVSGVTEVQLDVGVMNAEQRAAFIERVRGKRGKRTNQFREGTLTRVIAVTSGKGGVGKSSITANLAAALSLQGVSVGIIDADIFGFSIPSLMGLTDDGVTASPTRIDDMIVAPEAHGVKVISIGMFLGGADARHTAVSWRGPMLHRTIEQFLSDVWFGDLDILLIDLPPGTGDIALSIGQLLPHSEVIVVTTPQVSAADVAVRSGILAQQTGQKIIGVIENMSGFVQPDGSVIDLFGEGGGSEVATRLSDRSPEGTTERDRTVPLLARVPLTVAFRESGDAGVPLVVNKQDDPAAQALLETAQRIAKRPDTLRGRSLPLST